MSKDINDTIYFYKIAEPYGAFSNFSRHPIKIGKKTFATTEHYFQSQKFVNTDIKHYNDIVNANKPSIAASLGRDRSKPLRKDWESVKDSVMYDALYAKFTQYPELKELLLSTKDAKIVENTSDDYYWGCGSDKSGKNMLGILLMRLREVLKQEEIKIIIEKNNLKNEKNEI